MVNAQQLAPWIDSEVNVWQARVVDPKSSEIDTGSDLDLQPPLPDGVDLALVAWRALGTAGEHLALAQVMRSGGGSVLTKPFLTLARTVMLGAARVLYLLSPDEQETRHLRGLQLLRAEAQDTRNFVENWEQSAGGAPSELAISARTFQAECEAALQRLGKPAKSQMRDGELLRQAAQQIEDPPAAGATRQMFHLWNLSSATAHARAWAWDGGFEDDSAVDRYCAVWSLPVGMLDEAWQRWEMRRRRRGGAA